MTMMEQIMEKLGVELNEEFSVKYKWCTFYDSVKFVKTDESIQLVVDENDMPGLFMNLLNGVATIIKKPWRPKDEQMFYYVSPNGRVTYHYDQTHSEGINLIMIGNCYRTKKEAEQHIAYWKQVYKDMPEFKEVAE
jgi:hypothetical protein